MVTGFVADYASELEMLIMCIFTYRILLIIVVILS